MNVFSYRAALVCEACGLDIRRQLATRAPADPEAESTYDSDDYPKGPCPNGGGESDCPQHCDKCSLFLENPLTTEGREYVARMVDKADRRGRQEVTQEWESFYGITPDDWLGHPAP